MEVEEARLDIPIVIENVDGLNDAVHFVVGARVMMGEALRSCRPDMTTVFC